MLAIQTHDGLYDAGNEKYLKGFMPEQRPRTALPYILHQADSMAARIEYEMWSKNAPKKSTVKKQYPKKTLSNPSTNAQAMFKDLFGE